MKICYSANKAYLPGLLMASLSVALVTSEAIEIYVLTGDFHEVNPKFTAMEQDDVDFLESVLKLYNPDNKAFLIDMTKEYKEWLLISENKENSYSPYAMLRLFIDNYVSEGRIMHLDVDAMVLKDLSPLYHIEMGDNQIAMAPDSNLLVPYINRLQDYNSIKKNYPAKVKGEKSKYMKEYGNSGVTLFNLDNIKGTGNLALCREIVAKCKLIMPDQSAMNKVFVDRKIVLDRKYDELKKIRKDTVIRHYTMKPKPWDDIDNFHRMRGDRQFDNAILLAGEYLKLREENKEISLISAPNL